jgi:putative ABC transport system permease protein
MKNKFLHSIKISFLYFFANKLRAVLTIIGCSIGLIIYILGNALTISLTSSEIEKSQMFDRNSIIVRQTNQIKNFYSVFSTMPKNNHTRFLMPKYTLSMKYKYKEQKSLYVNFNLVGTTGALLSGPLINNKETNFCSRPKLLYGSDFQDGQASGFIIEKSTSKIIFGEGNAVGSNLMIHDRNISIQMPVIGIIQDSPITVKNNQIFNSNIQDDSMIDFSIDLMLYLPMSELNLLVEQYGLTAEESYIISLQSNEDVTEATNILNQQIPKSSITSYGTLMQKAISERNEAQKVVNIFSFIIVIVSAIFVMITMVFSLKERISEIGLRRAVGANTFDIIKQFINEGLIVCICSEIVAIFISIFAYNIMLLFLVKNFFINVTQYLPMKVLIASLAMSILQGVLFSIGPIMVATKIKPVNALRFE